MTEALFLRDGVLRVLRSAGIQITFAQVVRDGRIARSDQARRGDRGVLGLRVLCRCEIGVVLEIGRDRNIDFTDTLQMRQATVRVDDVAIAIVQSVKHKRSRGDIGEPIRLVDAETDSFFLHQVHAEQTGIVRASQTGKELCQGIPERRLDEIAFFLGAPDLWSERGTNFVADRHRQVLQREDPVVVLIERRVA